MYASFPYALAQGDVEIPYILVQTIIWAAITYFMMGFELTAGHALSIVHKLMTDPSTTLISCVSFLEECPCLTVTASSIEQDTSLANWTQT